jgi:ankyrin repeat protein
MGHNSISLTVPLHTAIENDFDIDSLRMLIDDAQEVLLSRNSVDYCGRNRNDTPLHLAIRSSADISVLKIMVDSTGLVLRSVNGSGDLPLHTVLRIKNDLDGVA